MYQLLPVFLVLKTVFALVVIIDSILMQTIIVSYVLEGVLTAFYQLLQTWSNALYATLENIWDTPLVLTRKPVFPAI